MYRRVRQQQELPDPDAERRNRSGGKTGSIILKEKRIPFDSGRLNDAAEGIFLRCKSCFAVLKTGKYGLIERG